MLIQYDIWARVKCNQQDAQAHASSFTEPLEPPQYLELGKVTGNTTCICSQYRDHLLWYLLSSFSLTARTISAGLLIHARGPE